MAYDEMKLTRVAALRSLAVKLKDENAQITRRLETLEGSIPVKVSDLTNDSGYQTEAQVSAAVAAADHLRRKKADSLDAIDPAAEGADRYIYMVPRAGAENGNLYDEYMVLDGAVEHVGSTEADLSGYVQKEAGKGLSANDFTDVEKAKLAELETASDAEVAEMLAEVFGPAQSE